jgi:hypothetical protein
VHRLCLLLLLAGCAGSSAVDAVVDRPRDVTRREGLSFVDGRVDGPTGDAAVVCARKAVDGTPLNPGCDLEVSALGPSALGELKLGSSAVWVLTRGARFWIYDPVQHAFSDAGASLALRLASTTQPACGSKSLDGTELNPGCDPGFQASGPTAIGQAKSGPTSKAYGLLTVGPKWWLLDPDSGAFVLAGQDLSFVLQVFAPYCSSVSPDGTPVNPGCDTSFQAAGPTAMGELTVGGKVVWVLTSAARYWLFDSTSGSGEFTASGKDVALALRAGFTPDCNATSADGTPINPGCDSSVQASGFGAVGELSISGATVWLFTAGAKHWIYDPALGTFTLAGQQIASLLRTL